MAYFADNRRKSVRKAMTEESRPELTGIAVAVN
jgi:hypothetical protein